MVTITATTLFLTYILPAIIIWIFFYYYVKELQKDDEFGMLLAAMIIVASLIPFINIFIALIITIIYLIRKSKGK